MSFCYDIFIFANHHKMKINLIIQIIVLHLIPLFNEISDKN